MKSNIVQIKELRVFEETNYVEQDESEETENQNMGPQGFPDEGEMIHNIVDDMEVEDQTLVVVTCCIVVFVLFFFFKFT